MGFKASEYDERGAAEVLYEAGTTASFRQSSAFPPTVQKLTASPS